MPVDTTAVKQMLDDELVSDGNRQIKAAGLRATLKALVDWVGSVAGVVGPAGPAGAGAPKVVQITTTSLGQTLIENGATYIIEKFNNTTAYVFELAFLAEYYPANGMRFTLIVGRYATVGFYVSNGNYNDALTDIRVFSNATPTNTIGRNVTVGSATYAGVLTLSKGVYECALLNGTLYIW